MVMYLELEAQTIRIRFISLAPPAMPGKIKRHYFLYQREKYEF